MARDREETLYKGNMFFNSKSSCNRGFLGEFVFVFSDQQILKCRSCMSLKKLLVLGKLVVYLQIWLAFEKDKGRRPKNVI